jgi:hypothetical protein
VTEPGAQTILAAVSDAYKQFGDYEDSGFVQSGTRSVVRFETRFVRGRFFEFAFSSDPAGGGDLRPTARIKAGPDGLEFWTALKGAPEPESLRLAVAALTGISFGAAHGAASLLLAEVGGWLPTDLRQPVLLPTRVVAGVTCLHIRGTHPRAPGEHSIFVEKDAHLIRGRISHGAPEQYTEYESCSAS